MKLTHKAILVITMTGMAAIIALVFLVFSYTKTRDAFLEKQIEMLSTIADTYTKGLDILLDSYIDKAGLVASRTQLRKLLAESNRDNTVNHSARMTRILNDAAGSDDDFAQLTVFDLRGNVVASTSKQRSVSADEREFLDLGLKQKRFESGFVETWVNQDSIQLVAYVPMRLDGVQVGFLQAFLTPSAFDHSIQTSVFGESGEVVLGIRDAAGGTYLITRVRESLEAARLQVDNGANRVAILHALDRNNAVLIDQTIDRFGTSVVAVTRYLPLLDWGLVVKIDRSGVESTLLDIRNDFLLAAGLIFCLGFGLSLYFGRLLYAVNDRLQNERERITREQADQRFKSVFTHSPVAMLMVGASGTIELANDQAENLLGYESTGLVGRSVDDLVPGEFRQQHQAYRSRFAAQNVPEGHYAMGANRDLSALHRNGEEVPVTIGLTPIETDNGPMVVAAITDMTERKATHDRIVAHAEALKRSNEELDSFAYIASHDLKAPLRGIAQLAQMIEEDAGELLPEESRTDLEMMQGRVHRLEKLLDGLLQYSRVGRVEREPAEIDLAVLCRDVEQTCFADSAFRLEIEGELPTVYAPRAAVELVFRNLLSNALKHHDRESGLVRISAEIDADQVRVMLLDDGPGIPAIYNSKVFELFQTLRRRDELESSGMGLAIVKKTMQSLGGHIELIQREGRGARFNLVFPSARGMISRLSA